MGKSKKIFKQESWYFQNKSKRNVPCGTAAQVRNAGRYHLNLEEVCVYMRAHVCVCVCGVGRGKRERGEHKPYSYDIHTFLDILQIHDLFATVLGVLVM
jgi:hypothetical protein